MQSSPYEPHHWKQICVRVSNIAMFLLPHLNRKKIKSEVISNLFESISGEYFNSIGINAVVASNDREPDLTFSTGPCEIKVTGLDHPFTRKCKWMGGKYSKRNSDHIFIMWNIYNGELRFSVYHCFVEESDWAIVDHGKQNYYATIFESSKLLGRDYKELVGHRNNDEFILESV